MKFYSNPLFLSRCSRTLREVCLLVAVTLALAILTPAVAQEENQPPPNIDSLNSEKTLQRLDSLSERLTNAQSLRKTFISERGGNFSDLTNAETNQLQEIDAEIDQLEASFELIVLGDIDTAAFKTPTDAPFNWQQELTEVAAPIVDSIKTLTEKPRQISELRNDIAQNKQQIDIADSAIATLEQQTQAPLSQATINQLSAVAEEWKSLKQSAEDQLFSNQTRLDRLKKNEVPIGSRMRDGVRSFVLGRGLTLLLAIVAAGLTWVILRTLWWFVVNKVLSKQTRRKAIWFRLVSYSIALLTGFAMFIAFIAVLQLRQDTLLLAIALVMVIAAALGLRNYLPNYINETRLLLNIGPVREEERLMINNIPWNVESINLQTIVRNPALNGVLRLPIADVKNLTSRPYRDDLWFPTDKGDYVLLPGDEFGQVLEQTPELVQIGVRGGMVKSVTTQEFYAMPITNLSRGESFGISIIFGLDYEIQGKSLQEIPHQLKTAVTEALLESDYAEASESLLVELNDAGASSLDYVIFAKFDAKHASGYFGIRRLMLHACIKACNENGWSIPFPQMVMHQA